MANILIESMHEVHSKNTERSNTIRDELGKMISQSIESIDLEDYGIEPEDIAVYVGISVRVGKEIAVSGRSVDSVKTAWANDIDKEILVHYIQSDLYEDVKGHL